MSHTQRNQPAKILLCWELGGGAGHLVCLRTIAKALMSLGHQLTFCLPAGADLSLLSELGGISVLQMQRPPSLNTPSATPFQASSFADVLGRIGFADPLALQPYIQMWRELLLSQAPDVILCDFAPSVCFAATGIAPTLSVGNGFASPPENQPHFAVLNPNVAPSYDPASIAQNAWQVACQLGFSQTLSSAALPRWVAAGQSLVRCYRHFDPYANLRSESVLGPLEAIGARRNPDWPANFFAYLSGDSQDIDRVIVGLCQTKFDGAVYARRLSPALRHQLHRSHLTVLPNPTDWSDVLPRVSLLIHHAGLGATQAGAAAGVPQLVIPCHLEQELTGLSILKNGIGAALVSPFAASDVTLGIERVMTNPDYRTAAMRLADELEAGGPYRFVDAVVQATEALL